MKTLKKKDLVCLILEDYRVERHFYQYWLDAKIRAETEGYSGQINYESFVHDHFIQADSLEQILISYGYSRRELAQIELSNLPSSELVK